MSKLRGGCTGWKVSLVDDCLSWEASPLHQEVSDCHGPNLLLAIVKVQATFLVPDRADVSPFNTLNNACISDPA
jgi:hypothetical protein